MAESAGPQIERKRFREHGVQARHADYSYDIQLFALSLVLMSQGAGALALKPFPGRVLLRWDLAAAAVAAALLLATLSKPQFKRSEQAGTPGSSGHQRQATWQPHGGGQPVTP
jgi:hypothetical protein